MAQKRQADTDVTPDLSGGIMHTGKLS
jgi:hypothetical protein